MPYFYGKDRKDGAALVCSNFLLHCDLNGHILHLPASDVENEEIVPASKPYLFPDATDISYVVYGVRLFILYSFTFGVVIPMTRLLPFFSSIRKFEKLFSPRYLGSCQDIVALRDVMAVIVRFVGLSGNGTSKKLEIKTFQCAN